MDNIIRISTVREEQFVAQKVIILEFIHFGVGSSRIFGDHISFNFGLGPMEMEWSLRLWHTRTK